MSRERVVAVVVVMNMAFVSLPLEPCDRQLETQEFSVAFRTVMGEVWAFRAKAMQIPFCSASLFSVQSAIVRT